MPEIWLNYGVTDVVLDIRAENLEQKIDSDGKILDDSVINEKLSKLDLSKPMELVVLHNSKSIQKKSNSIEIHKENVNYCSKNQKITCGALKATQEDKNVVSNFII